MDTYTLNQALLYDISAALEQTSKNKGAIFLSTS